MKITARRGVFKLERGSFNEFLGGKPRTFDVGGGKVGHFASDLGYFVTDPGLYSPTRLAFRDLRCALDWIQTQEQHCEHCYKV